MEVELKYRLRDEKQGEGILLELLGKDKEDTIRTVSMHSIYYDTENCALSGQNLSLRMRTENGKSVLNIKARVAGKKDIRFCDEWECEADTVREGLDKLPDTGYEIFSKLRSGDTMLVQVADIAFVRRYAEADIGGGNMAELCVDHGTMSKSTGPIYFAELEAELKQGYNIEAFSDFGRTLEKRWALEAEPQSKLERAYEKPVKNTGEWK